MVGVGSGGHALEDARLVEVFAKVTTLVLAAAITVKDEARFRSTRVLGLNKGLGDLAGAQVVVEGPAHDTPGAQVDDDSQIKPALRGGNEGDVARPHSLRTGGKTGLEKEVGRGTISPAIAGLRNVCSGLNGPETSLCHEPAHPGGSAANGRFIEILPDPSVTVAPTMAVKDLFDRLNDLLVGEFRCGGMSSLVVAAAGNAEDRADRADAVSGLLVNFIDHFPEL